MTNNKDNKILLMDEYKEGFQEIHNLVNEFEELSIETQAIFIKERVQFLEEQLHDLKAKKSDYWKKNRIIIAQINSRFKAFNDSEKNYQKQISECQEFLSIVNKRIELDKSISAENIAETRGAENKDETMAV